MATVTSNIDQIIKRLENKLSVELPNKVVKDISEEIFESSIARIFINGLNTNFRKIGKYSKSYKLTRSKHGLQTTFVNLQFTGHLRSLYRLKKKGDYYSIGFTDSYGSRIAGYMEQKFKCKIFALTDKDVILAQKIINKWIKII